MKNISLLILLLALISQTSFSQNQIPSDSEIARDLYEQGLLTSPAVPFHGKKVLAIASSIVIPGTGQFINGQFGIGSIFLGGAVGSVLLMSVGWGPAVVGFIAYIKQLQKGLGITGMRDYASWGIYISNFVFLMK